MLSVCTRRDCAVVKTLESRARSLSTSASASAAGRRATLGAVTAGALETASRPTRHSRSSSSSSNVSSTPSSHCTTRPRWTWVQRRHLTARNVHVEREFNAVISLHETSTLNVSSTPSSHCTKRPCCSDTRVAAPAKFCCPSTCTGYLSTLQFFFH